MHKEECIVCDICGLKVARITRSWFFGWPKRFTEFSYITITDTQSQWRWRTDGAATNVELHLCHDCFLDLKAQVEHSKREENKDEQKTDS